LGANTVEKEVILEQIIIISKPYIREGFLEALLREVPCMTSGSEDFAITICGAHRARCEFVGKHE
jgi:hypothetical protein